MAGLFAIYHGLSMLVHLGMVRAICSNDLILNRDNHASHHYASLLLKITSLRDLLPGWELMYVPREANNSANYLAKYANKHL